MLQYIRDMLDLFYANKHQFERLIGKKRKEKITYIPYAIDIGWFKYAKSVIEDKTNKYKKYEYEDILEDLLSYEEEIKTNKELKQIVIEEIGEIKIFIEKVKERIKEYDKKLNSYDDLVPPNMFEITLKKYKR